MTNATNHDSASRDPFAFLTAKRVELFKRALQTARQKITNYIQENSLGYWKMPKREQRNLRRAIYIAELTSAFAKEEGVCTRQDNGGMFLVFDGGTVVDAKKLNRRTLQAWIPNILRQNDGYKQLPLDKFVNEENIPLNQLSHVIAGFIENKLGDFEAFYFTKQDGETVVNRMPLEIDTLVPFEESTAEGLELPAVKFRARKQSKPESDQ